MKRNKDKINSKYRIHWFGSVTEVPQQSEIFIGSGGSVRFGSVRVPFLPPTNFGTETKKSAICKRANLILLTQCFY